MLIFDSVQLGKGYLRGCKINCLMTQKNGITKRMLLQSGFIKGQESRSALEDKEAAGYLDLAVSGNEESKVEDNNSDPEAGEVVEGLEERWDQDA